jgi:hypothetical protein
MEIKLTAEDLLIVVYLWIGSIVATWSVVSEYRTSRSHGRSKASSGWQAFTVASYVIIWWAPFGLYLIYGKLRDRI